MSSERFTEGELFVYVNGDRWELGMVKRPNNTGDGYFCWYSTGDTAANTPVDHMHKLANHGFTKMEGLLRAATSVSDATATRQCVGTCHRVQHEGDTVFQYCSECGGMLARWIDYTGSEPCFCPSCGRRVV